MAETLDAVIAGEPLRLLAGRALHWPAKRRLLIADLHLGKADAFRRAGIGLPIGGTGGDLQRLDALVAATSADEVWILGDVLHAAIHPAAWRERWRQWRERHPRLRVIALAGNHDRALFAAAADLRLELAGEAIFDAPFVLRHLPQPEPGWHVLCGHLHPRIAVPGLPRRWPAFWLREGLTVLPAFSAFTGGMAPAAAAPERLAACVEGSILWVPPPAGERARKSRP